MYAGGGGIQGSHFAFQPSIRGASTTSASSRSSPLSFQPHSFSSSSRAQSQVPGSPSFDSPQFPDDPFARNVPSPLGIEFQPGAYSSISPHDPALQGLERRIDTLSHQVYGLQTNLKETNAKLDTLISAVKGGLSGNSKHAPWIYEGDMAYQQLPLITEGSEELKALQARFPAITTWLPSSEKAAANKVAPLEKRRVPGGRGAVAKGENNTARYIENDLGEVIDGHELSRMTELLRSLFHDLLAADLVKPRYTELGVRVTRAIVFEMERTYPCLGRCTNHWKALALIKSRYRHWAIRHVKAPEQVTITR